MHFGQVNSMSKALAAEGASHITALLRATQLQRQHHDNVLKKEASGSNKGRPWPVPGSA